jgi:hypothetical protein
MIRRLIKRLLMPPMVVVAAAIMFFEEWLWDHLAAAMAWVARARVLRWLEARLAALPPYPAMAVFVIPGVLLLPVKLAALYLMAHGQAGSGLLVIVTAKIIGTAVVARIFTVCRPALVTVGWFRRLYEGIIRVKTRLYGAVKATAAWAAAVRWKNAIKARFPAGGHFLRQWKAIGVTLRRKFSRRQGAPQVGPVGNPK